jgi:hypothetical protein
MGIEAAPLLVVLNPQGQLAYSGGYTQRKGGPEIEDTTILAKVQQAMPPTSLPIFGCAVSERLKRELSILPKLTRQ